MKGGWGFKGEGGGIRDLKIMNSIASFMLLSSSLLFLMVYPNSNMLFIDIMIINIVFAIYYLMKVLNIWSDLNGWFSSF